MKTVLISIKEKWWKKILSGEKELEIRKNRPKGIEYPFRVVCYVTGRGIMGAFTCDYIKKTNDYKELSECSGLEPGKLFEYANGANGKTDTCLYGWHVQEGTAVEFDQAFKIDTAGVTRPPQSWCYVVGPGECHKELQEQVKATLNRIYPRKKVSDILPKPEILGQLAEELAEASAAVSKLRRKIDGKNPTPKTLEECWEDLKKEIGDVMNSIDALTEQDPQNYHEFMSECGEYAEPKMERWLCRLNEQKEKHT